MPRMIGYALMVVAWSLALAVTVADPLQQAVHRLYVPVAHAMVGAASTSH